MAQALNLLGIKSAAVVFGHNGLDELSTTGINDVIYIRDGQLKADTIDPKDYQIEYSHLDQLAGGDPKANVDITKSILAGAKGSKSDIVALNTGLALYVTNKTSNLEKGIQMAYELIESRAGLKVIERLKET